MSAKRRDNKRRVLRFGESQRPDGRYMYKYKDVHGKWKYLYSWKLEPTDKVPAGKRDCVSLREQERAVFRDKLDGVASNGGKLTVAQLVERYIKQKTGVRHNTVANYNFVLNIVKKEPFGEMQIDKVKPSDAKLWLIKLQADGKGYSTIHTIRGVVRPAFQMAVDDDLIRKNPFDFQLATVVVNDSVTREALTRKQEREFLRFVKEDRHYRMYYEGIYILFKTGMRISEFVGLTVYDVDFQSHTINIDHQLQRKRNMTYVIEQTKTNAGTRVIPMSPDVEECFRTIIQNRPKPKQEPEVDGYSGFLYLDKNGNPMVALHWEHYFNRLVEKYNEIYKVEMPKVTPHVCRHTYCSNMAKSGMNPKTLQYLMGHSDISVTLNTYTHVGLDDARSELERLNRGNQRTNAEL